MKKLLFTTLALIAVNVVFAQTPATYSDLTLTKTHDQLKFDVPNQNRYWIMSKTASDNKAFALYSPEDGGWFTYWKETSGDMIVNKGKVGIGTSNPLYKLDVSGTARFSNNLTIANSKYLYMGSVNDRIKAESGNIGLYPNNNLYIGAVISGNEVKNVSFLENGKVGIGTTNPDSKLTVNGAIHSQEVKVDIAAGTGPDYVFEADYNLISLEETKAYIEANNHLPEVPSAKVMESEGLELRDMSLLLLKKIEEMTLHQIKLMEEVKSLKAKVQELEK